MTDEQIDPDAIDPETFEDVEPVEDEGVDEATVAAQEPEEEALDWSEEDEKEARMFGWKSPDEWAGEKPASYIANPKEYLEYVPKSRVFGPIVEHVEKIKKDFAEHARKVEALSTKMLAEQKAKHDKELADIRAKQRKAVYESDVDAFEQLEKDRIALEAAVNEPVDDTPKGPPPEVVEYREKNPWAKNPIIWGQMVQAVNQMPNLSTATPMEQLEFAENAIREAHPHLFRQEEKPKPRQKVSSTGIAPGKAKASAFDKLPASAREAFKTFVREGVFTNSAEDKEEYAREYNAV